VISNKATSAAIVAMLLGIIAFGVWLVTPGSVDAATEELNATTTNVTVNVYVSCGAPANYADGINFGSLDPETTNNPAEGYTFTSPTTNNVNINYYIKANGDLTRGGVTTDFIKLGNYTWDDNETLGNVVEDAHTLTTNFVSFDNTSIPPGGSISLQLWLDIPVVTPGTYNNTITIKCNQSSS